MQTESLYNLLSNQLLFNGETATELKSLTEKYPWFNLAWMLYLKNLKQIESPDYQTFLKKVAARAPNRKLLNNFIHTENQKTEKPDRENPLSALDGFDGETENNMGNP